MKPKILSGILFLFIASDVFAQGTAFTYQGRLNDGGSPATGIYDLRFKLYSGVDGINQVSSTILTNGVSLTGGLFAVTLDFGGGVFNGSNYWLGVDVRTNGGSSYQALSPLQPLLPTPYAIFASTASNLSGAVPSANLSGTYGSAVVISNSANSFSGSFGGNGASVTNVNAASLNGLASSNFWKTSGNAGTSPTNGNFIGTTDFQPLDLKAGNIRVLRLEPDTRFALAGNVIGGFTNNRVLQPGSGGDFIGGGGYSAGPNIISSNSSGDFIGAGSVNLIGPNVGDAVIVGGFGNSIVGGGLRSIIVGGENNLVQSNADRTFIGGGYNNIILTNSVFAVVPGGSSNVAGGKNSFAAGSQAQATNDGSFVWSDTSVPGIFNSTRSNQFLIRAGGGVGIGTNNPSAALHVEAGGGTNIALRVNGGIAVSGAGLLTGTAAFIHVANATNTASYITTIYNPLCDNDPNAILIVTHSWNPPGVAGNYDTHVASVFYSAPNWTIYHDDAAPS